MAPSADISSPVPRAALGQVVHEEMCWAQRCLRLCFKGWHVNMGTRLHLRALALSLVWLRVRCSYRAGLGILGVRFPLQRLFEWQLLRGFSLERLGQLSLVLNVGVLRLTTEGGFMCMKACLLFPPTFPKHSLSHVSAVLRSSCPK